MFEERFKVLYSQENGCPCVPIRRMVGLLISDLPHGRKADQESYRAVQEAEQRTSPFGGVFSPSRRVTRTRCTQSTSRRSNASARVKNTRNTSSATRSPLSARQGGLIIGAMSFRNEYDGHTIDPALQQVERLTGRRLKVLAGDRGYRGQKMSGTTKEVIPDTPKASDSYYKRRKKHDLFCKRAGIEPVIGHLKSDHRLGRNFYKGVFGDDINIMLSAAAFNFKRAMRLLLRLFSDGIAESTAMMKNLAGTSHRELNIPPHTASS